jgi:membrane protein DedA with SNARE-associated domain
VLLAAGFLVSAGRMEPIPAILVATLGAVLGDSATYWLGRRAGVAGQRRLVGLYCAWTACTLGSAHCVKRAEGLLRRCRGSVVLVAKFIAGARVFVPPIAGVSALSFRRFLLFDAAGSLMWTALIIGVGARLGYERETAVGKFVRASDLLAAILAAFLAVYVAWKVAWRRRYGPPSSRLATPAWRETEASEAEPSALRTRWTP